MTVSHLSWIVSTTGMIVMMILSRHVALGFSFQQQSMRNAYGSRMATTTSSLRMMTSSPSGPKPKRGKLLILGGTGFLGQTICKRANLEGYSVTSLSRRGVPPPSKSTDTTSAASSSSTVDYRMGDARNIESIQQILNEGGYVGVIHCIGLLFDDSSGIGNLNAFVSGSGSVPDENSTYDAITRQSAFNAIDATLEYVQNLPKIQSDNNDNNDIIIPSSSFPLVFISAAEAGWPDVKGGVQVERFLAPKWLKRYLEAKRKVEQRLLSMECSPTLRPVIPRPSLIYSLDRPASYLPVGAFFVGNKVGLPFVDRPVTVQSLANAIVRSISSNHVRGIQRYKQIDELNQ